MKRSELVAAALILGFTIVLLVFGFYPTARQTPRNACMANLKALSNALGTYVADADGVFPPDGRWADVLYPNEVESLATFACPEARPTREQADQIRAGGKFGIPTGYALFKPLVGCQSITVATPEKTPVLFDSTMFAANASADLSSLATRHAGKTAVLYYADGHSAVLTAPPPLPHPLFLSLEEALKAAEKAARQPPPEDVPMEHDH